MREVNTFCQRNDTERVRKGKHYINTYILNTNTGSNQALKDSELLLKSKICPASHAHAFKDATQP